MEADERGVDIFSEGLLDRPHLFQRYIRRYILEGFQELNTLRIAEKKALDSLEGA